MLKAGLVIVCVIALFGGVDSIVPVQRIPAGKTRPLTPPAKPAQGEGPFADLRADIFEMPPGSSVDGVRWEPFPSVDPDFKQRQGFDYQDRIYCETFAQINATPERLIQLIRGKWTWWVGGKQEDIVNNKDGTIDYMLYPAYLGVKVHEVMQKPVPITQGKYAGGTVIRINFLPDRKSFASGLGYFLIMPTPGTFGKQTNLYGRFAGVKSLNPLMTTKFFTKAHLQAEGGNLFGIGKKTGWYHLKKVALGLEPLPSDFSFFG